MADASTSAAPEEQMANLLLDPVTGENVSKSELKRRQKQRQKEDEKKKKAAAAPPKPAKKESGEAEEKDLNPNVWKSRSTSTNTADSICSNTSRFVHEISRNFVNRRTQTHTHTSFMRITILGISPKNSNLSNLENTRRMSRFAVQVESSTSVPPGTS